MIISLIVQIQAEINEIEIRKIINSINGTKQGRCGKREEYDG